jgi:hypothetical protein
LQNGTTKQVPVAHYPRLNGTSKFGLKIDFVTTLIAFAYLWMKQKQSITVLKKELLIIKVEIRIVKVFIPNL